MHSIDDMTILHLDRQALMLRRVGKRLGFEGWRDLGFFVDWDLIVVGAGTALLAVVEMEPFEQSWPGLHAFIDERRVWLLLLALALIILSPMVSRGIRHLRARQLAIVKNGDISIMLRGLDSRAANLIHKLQEVFSGEIKQSYQNHLLDDCRQYFSSRANGPDGTQIDVQAAFEVNFYEMRKSKGSTLLERKLFTNSDGSQMRSNFSSRGSLDERLAIEMIGSGKHVFCGDVRDPAQTEPLKISDGDQRNYRSFLSVPVYRDRKDTSAERVIGMLSINSSAPLMLFESDKRLLTTYAWFLSVAMTADTLGKSRQIKPQTGEFAYAGDEGGKDA